MFSSALSLLSRIYVTQGRPDDALLEIKRVRFDYQRIYLYAVTYTVLGREKQSDAALKELIAKYSTREAFLVASIYAFQNQRDEALEWLDRTYAQREGSLAGTNLWPELKNLHGDPRYSAFLKTIHLAAFTYVGRTTYGSPARCLRCRRIEFLHFAGKRPQQAH